MSITSKVMEKMPAAAQDIVPAYYTDTMAIFKPKGTFENQAAFNCYHFAIPSSPYFPALKVDNKSYQLVCNRVFPANPGQILECFEGRETREYVALFMDKQLMDDVCFQICKSSDVFFINKSSLLSNYGQSLISQFIQEYTNRQLGCEFILQSLSMQLAVTLIRELETNISRMPDERSLSGKDNINRAIVFLKECYNSDFTLKDIAKIANLSPYHFIRMFKTETGKTPFEYLMDIKVEKSRELLKLEQYSITDIALICGFTSASHFSTVFSKKTGVPPSKYRRMILYGKG